MVARDVVQNRPSWLRATPRPFAVVGSGSADGAVGSLAGRGVQAWTLADTSERARANAASTPARPARAGSAAIRTMPEPDARPSSTAVGRSTVGMWFAASITPAATAAPSREGRVSASVSSSCHRGGVRSTRCRAAQRRRGGQIGRRTIDVVVFFGTVTCDALRRRRARWRAGDPTPLRSASSTTSISNESRRNRSASSSSWPGRAALSRRSAG
jgi:hypothetical protein